jgi:hypothetical protein
MLLAWRYKLGIKRYGETNTESAAKASANARAIVSEILNFGVTQQQILRVAYLLSLELENREMMIDISTCIKEYVDDLGEPKKNNVIET